MKTAAHAPEACDNAVEIPSGLSASQNTPMLKTPMQAPTK